MPNQQYPVQRQIRVSEDEYNRITRAAKEMNISRSAYLRHRLFEEPPPPRLATPSTTEQVKVGISDMLKKTAATYQMLQARAQRLESSEDTTVTKATYKRAITQLDNNLTWLVARCLKTRVEIERHTEPNRLPEPHSYFLAQAETDTLNRLAKQRPQVAVRKEDRLHNRDDDYDE